MNDEARMTNDEGSPNVQMTKLTVNLPNTRYYYAKIDTGNRGAGKWLSGNNPLNRPAVPIYFDRREEAEYRQLLEKLKVVGAEALRKGYSRA